MSGGQQSLPSMNYRASMVRLRPGEAMAGANRQFGNLSNTMGGLAQGFLSGQSPILQQQREQMMQGIGDMTSQQGVAQNRMLAQRGMGGGGMRAGLNTGAQGAAGEQMRKGLLGIAGQGMQQGVGMLRQMYGQTGQMAMQGEQNALQAALANQAARNQQQQFTLTGDYNAAMARNQASGDMFSNVLGAGANIVGTAASAKAYMMCIPEGTKIDTTEDNINIEKLKAGDEVIGYDGTSTTILQKHEYKENPDSNRFLEITLNDDSKINLCDMHRIEGKRSKDYHIGDNIVDKTITDIREYGGVTRSYDLLTSDKGYQISEIPINSMIEELASETKKLQEAL